MKAIKRNSMALVLMVAFAATAWGQDPEMDRVVVPLTDPSRGVTLKASIMSGSITVKGYSGKEVIVEALPRSHETRQDKNPEKGGLRRIQNSSSGLTVEEEDNVVSVGTGWRGNSRPTDITIQVPVNCSMKISTVNDGHIVVENINGDIEVNNTNGRVTLTDISGSAVAHALNGNIVANFLKVNSQKSMSFSSLNGKIDVTLPPSIKATMYLKSDMGEIYTDFDITMERTSSKVEDSKEKRGKYKVTIEKGMRGTINGGGQEFQFNNFNGDIYVRKGK